MIYSKERDFLIPADDILKVDRESLMPTDNKLKVERGFFKQNY